MSRDTAAMPAWCEEQRRRYDDLVTTHADIDGPLADVVAYALEGGKRLRPILAVAFGDALGAPALAVTRTALAVEYLHSASLLLDDLPAMDRAEVRRGRPPAHAAFSEGAAILAAVALVARAYAVVSAPDGDPAAGGRMAQLISQAIGAASGMTGGQARELALGARVDPGEVSAIHDRKTGALFALVPRLLAVSVDAPADVAAPLVRFAELFGTAYQIADDLHDREVEGEQRGNLACTLGPAAARDQARARLRDALAELAPLGEGARRLEECALWLSERLDVG